MLANTEQENTEKENTEKENTEKETQRKRHRERDTESRLPILIYHWYSLN